MFNRKLGTDLAGGLKGWAYVIAGTYAFYYAAAWYIRDVRREELQLGVVRESWEARRKRIFKDDDNTPELSAPAPQAPHVTSPPPATLQQ